MKKLVIGILLIIAFCTGSYTQKFYEKESYQEKLLHDMIIVAAQDERWKNDSQAIVLRAKNMTKGIITKLQDDDLTQEEFNKKYDIDTPKEINNE